MPYEKQQSKQFDYPFEKVFQAVTVTIQDLGGKVLKSEPENKLLHAQMDKRMKGEMLGDRSKLEIKFAEEESGETKLSILAYPLNAVGQKLMFGARKGVVEQVLSILLEDVEKRLSGNH